MTSSGCPRLGIGAFLQRIHAPSGGQLSQILDQLSPAGRDSVRYPHPEVLQVLDPRPLLDSAASITARYRAGGLLIAATLAAGLAYGHQLWFGPERNIGRSLAAIAGELGVAVHATG